MNRPPWPWIDVFFLYYLAAEGLSQNEVAARLGRTRPSIHHKARREGVEFPVTEAKLTRTCNHFLPAREGRKRKAALRAALIG